MHKKHWVFICELGANFGHITPLLHIAKLAAAQGARISFIVPSLTHFYSVMPIDCDFSLYQSPVNLFQKAKPNSLPQSYSESLLLHGYAQEKPLAVAIKVWRSLLLSLKPDIGFFDYAPTALLASREFSFKKIMLGNGYCVPPVKCEKLPLLKRSIDPIRINTSDQKVLNTVNGALKNNEMLPLNSLNEMTPCDARFLKTIPFFDSYCQYRTTEKYLGLLPVLRPGKDALWCKVTTRKKVFAYLSTQFPFIKPLIQWLKLHFVGHVFLTGNDAQQLSALSGDNFTISTEAYNMDSATTGCDFVICHAGSGTVAWSLLAAKPLVCIPLQAEQQYVAEKVAELGAGIFVPPEPTWDQWLPAIQAITVKLPELQKNTVEFLLQYREEFGNDDPFKVLLNYCVALINEEDRAGLPKDSLCRLD